MLSLSILAEPYHPQNNNCGHFVVKIWKQLTGQDITKYLLQPLDKIAGDFTKLKEPQSPCLTVMTFGGVTHVGVWYEGKLLHMTDKGPVYQELSSVKENFKYRFYK